MNKSEFLLKDISRLIDLHGKGDDERMYISTRDGLLISSIIIRRNEYIINAETVFGKSRIGIIIGDAASTSYSLKYMAEIHKALIKDLWIKNNE